MTFHVHCHAQHRQFALHRRVCSDAILPDDFADFCVRQGECELHQRGRIAVDHDVTRLEVRVEPTGNTRRQNGPAMMLRSPRQFGAKPRRLSSANHDVGFGNEPPRKLGLAEQPADDQDRHIPCATSRKFDRLRLRYRAKAHSGKYFG